MISKMAEGNNWNYTNFARGRARILIDTMASFNQRREEEGQRSSPSLIPLGRVGIMPRNLRGPIDRNMRPGGVRGRGASFYAPLCPGGSRGRPLPPPSPLPLEDHPHLGREGEEMWMAS